MRIYKETYTKPIPEGAKIITRKGVRSAQFKDRGGYTTQARLTKSGDRILCGVKEWHIGFEDGKGIRRSLIAYTDRATTDELGIWIHKLLDKNGVLDGDLKEWFFNLNPSVREQLVEFGLVSNLRMMQNIGKTLEEHLEDFYKSLLVKEDGARHAKQVKSQLKDIFFEGCEFRLPTDIDANTVYRYLGERRKSGEISQRTFNCYLGFAQHFCEWMKKEQRTAANPLEHLEGVTETVKKRERRAIRQEDLMRLLEKTRAAEERFGMTGEERWLLYVLACQTGMRASDLRRLKVGSFDLDNLTVKIRASCSKNKKEKTLPLKPSTAAMLKVFFKGKLPGVKAFGGTYKSLTDKTAEMLREDLAEAGIEYVDSAGRFFDFHSLRKEAGTLMKQAGVNMKDAQSILRHGSIDLTSNIYTETFSDDERDAVSKLPDFAAGKQKKAGA